MTLARWDEESQIPPVNGYTKCLLIYILGVEPCSKLVEELYFVSLQPLTSGSMRFFSSLIASSLAQNRIPSMMASTPVFFPGETLLSNSFVSTSFASTENTDSLTRDALIFVHGAGRNPVSAHSDIPWGALIEVLFAASTKCSEMMLMQPI